MMGSRFSGNCETAAVAFVESIATVIRTDGSESLGVYKLLASTLDNVAVKKVSTHSLRPADLQSVL